MGACNRLSVHLEVNPKYQIDEILKKLKSKKED